MGGGRCTALQLCGLLSSACVVESVPAGYLLANHLPKREDPSAESKEATSRALESSGAASVAGYDTPALGRAFRQAVCGDSAIMATSNVGIRTAAGMFRILGREERAVKRATGSFK